MCPLIFMCVSNMHSGTTYNHYSTHGATIPGNKYTVGE